MKRFKYKDHTVVIQKKKGTSSERIITILKGSIPPLKQVTEFEGNYSMKKAENMAKDYIGV